MQKDHRNIRKPKAAGTEDHNNSAEQKSGCLRALGMGLLLTASPLLSLLMPHRNAESTDNGPVKEAIPLVQKDLSKLAWHKNISPDQFSPNSYTCKVKPGDSIYKIAKQYDVPADLIMSLNNRFNQEADQIFPGEVLFLPAMRGVKLDDKGWHGKVFSLNLESKSDWIYMCQHLVCSQAIESPVRKAISCSMQYMPSELRRAFVSKICETLREICSDEIVVPSETGRGLPRLAKLDWPNKNAEKLDKYKKLSAAYAWALGAALKQRCSSPFPGEDAIREVIPHPFRINTGALIASVESLRAVGFIKYDSFSPQSFGLKESQTSIAAISSYATANSIDIKSGKQPYVLINFGTGDHNGVFSNAQVIMEAGKAAKVPVVFIESYDRNDMLSQSQRFAAVVGRKPASIVLGGHGGLSESECSLQIGYDTWLRKNGSDAYCLSSKRDPGSISEFASKTILLVSCDSGAKTPKGVNFVDAIAQALQQRKPAGTIYVYGMNKPSNILAAQIRADGSIVPTLGPKNSDAYSRKVVVKK